MIEGLKLDNESLCLSSNSIREIFKRQHALMHVESTFGDSTIKAVRCKIKGWDGIYLADRVTGTLYRENDGSCLTSSFRRITGPAEKEIPNRFDANGFCCGTQPINPKASPVIVEKKKEKIDNRGKQCGEKKGSAKVTEAIVRQIRELRECSLRYYKLTSKQCQEKFGIGKSTVDDIRQRKTWRHVV